MLEYFHTFICPWNQEKGMWSMFGVVREVRDRTDYILDTDRCIFRNMSVLDSRNCIIFLFGLNTHSIFYIN